MKGGIFSDAFTCFRYIYVIQNLYNICMKRERERKRESISKIPIFYDRMHFKTDLIIFINDNIK